MASSVIKVEPTCKAWVIRELSMHSQEQIPLVGLLDLVKQSGYRNARKLMTTWRLLCKEAELSEDVFTSLTRFVCSAYCPSDINIQCTPLKCIGYAHKRSMQISGVQWTAPMYSRPTLNINALCCSQSFENAL